MAARGVAAAGPLDLDHVGAEVGQVAGAARPGHHRGQVDHPQAVEGGHRRSLVPTRPGDSAGGPTDRLGRGGRALARTPVRAVEPGPGVRCAAARRRQDPRSAADRDPAVRGGSAGSGPGPGWPGPGWSGPSPPWSGRSRRPDRRRRPGSPPGAAGRRAQRRRRPPPRRRRRPRPRQPAGRCAAGGAGLRPARDLRATSGARGPAGRSPPPGSRPPWRAWWRVAPSSRGGGRRRRGGRRRAGRRRGSRAGGGCGGGSRSGPRRGGGGCGLARGDVAGLGADAGQQAVAGVAGAGGGGHVAVAGDGGGGDRAAGGVAVGAPAGEGDGGAGLQGHVVAVGQGAEDAGQGVEGGAGGGHVGKGADEAAQLRRALVAAGGVAAHGVVQAAGAALEGAAEPVDQEVVGDVGPALLRPGVQVVERAQVGHRAGLVVGVAGGRVVHQQEAHVLALQGTLRWEVGAPRGTGEHGGGAEPHGGGRGGGGGGSQEPVGGQEAGAGHEQVAAAEGHDRRVGAARRGSGSCRRGPVRAPAPRARRAGTASAASR